MLARAEETTLSNLTCDLIEEGLKARKSEKIVESSAVLERLDVIGSLLKAQIRAAAAGQSYARQAAIAAQDIASIWAEQVNASESSQNRKEAISSMDADSQDFAQWWVKSG